TQNAYVTYTGTGGPGLLIGGTSEVVPDAGTSKSSLQIQITNNNHYSISCFDTENQVAGCGGNISFGGKYTNGGAYARFAFFAGWKENSTSGNSAAKWVVYLNNNTNADAGFRAINLSGANSGAMTLASAAVLGFANTGDASNSADIGLTRNA